MSINIEHKYYMMVDCNPLNSPKTMSAKFCHRSFLAQQQMDGKSYDGKILPFLH